MPGATPGAGWPRLHPGPHRPGLLVIVCIVAGPDRHVSRRSYRHAGAAPLQQRRRRPLPPPHRPNRPQRAPSSTAGDIAHANAGGDGHRHARAGDIHRHGDGSTDTETPGADGPPRTAPCHARQDARPTATETPTERRPRRRRPPSVDPTLIACLGAIDGVFPAILALPVAEQAALGCPTGGAQSGPAQVLRFDRWLHGRSRRKSPNSTSSGYGVVRGSAASRRRRPNCPGAAAARDAKSPGGRFGADGAETRVGDAGLCHRCPARAITRRHPELPGSCSSSQPTTAPWRRMPAGRR